MPSNQKPSWRSGPQRVYIARDKRKELFKIGMTGQNLKDYCKQLCYRAYGAGSIGKIEICLSWPFYDFWAAWYIEQTTIALIERFGFEQAREGNWYSIDKPTLAEIIYTIDDLVVPIRSWEQTNFDRELKCRPPRHRPWGRAMKRAGVDDRDFAETVFPLILLPRPIRR